MTKLLQLYYTTKLSYGLITENSILRMKHSFRMRSNFNRQVVWVLIFRLGNSKVVGVFFYTSDPHNWTFYYGLNLSLNFINMSSLNRLVEIRFHLTLFSFIDVVINLHAALDIICKYRIFTFFVLWNDTEIARTLTKIL